MKNHGFELPAPPPRRNARQNVIEREEGVDVTGAVSYLEEAERGSIGLTNAVKDFAGAAKALLEGGLNEEAITLLLQYKMPRHKNGDLVSRKTILDTLQAAARLHEYLKPE